MNFFNLSSSVLITYALLVLAGGIYGYGKAGSLPSLIAGASLFVVLSLSALSLYCSKNWAYPLSMTVLLLSISLFAYRYSRSFHFWPGGLLGLLGIITLLSLFFLHSLHKK
jgi:uncharacterized membrane protein (UPF0136 family)